MRRPPWTSQGLAHRDGWVGVAPGRPGRWHRVGEARGWSPTDWLDAYRTGLAGLSDRDSAVRPNIAAYMLPEEALGAVQAAEPRTRALLAAAAVLPPDRLGGCLTRSARARGDGTCLAEPYRPLSKELLPLVARAPRLSATDANHVRAALATYQEQGVCRPWDFACWGLPTVISPPFVVTTDVKVRVVIDYRYANGAVAAAAMELPTVQSIALRNKNRRVGKADLESGFHQVELDPAHRHAAALMFEGVVYYLAVMSFGWRSAPAEFQRRTALSGLRAAAASGSLLVDVYLDDFMTGHDDPTEGDAKTSHAGFTQRLQEDGWRVSAKKTRQPLFNQEILGIEADTRSGILQAGTAKSLKMKELFSALIQEGPRSTLHLARVLGKAVSLIPAVRNLMLLLRPLFAVLKSALRAEFPTDLPRMTRGKDAESYTWSDRPIAGGLPSGTTDSVVFLIENWDTLNGKPIARPPHAAELILRGDASADGTGCIVERRRRCGTIEKVAEVADTLTPLEATLSSLAREAIVVCRTLLGLPTELLSGAYVTYHSDNRGLSDIFYVGSPNEEPTGLLIQTVKHLHRLNCTWDRTTWLPRELMVEEDALSRRRAVGAARLACDQGWFDGWCSSLDEEERPNIDAFAEAANHKLSKYASMDGSGAMRDGCRTPWKRAAIPYMFPPTNLPLIRRALSNWATSESELCYLLIAEPLVDVVSGVARTHGDCSVLPCSPRVDVPPYAAKKNWTFKILRCSKAPLEI
jgi:hypothetical protein